MAEEHMLPDVSTQERDTSCNLDEAVSSFELIASVLKEVGEDHDAACSDTTLELPLEAVLALLPEHYVQHEQTSAEIKARTVRIVIDDLFEQLGRGRVSVSVATLVFGIPADIVAPDALRDTETILNLPLPLVVGALNPDVLNTHTAKTFRVYKIQDLPNLFESSAGRTHPETQDTDVEPDAIAPPPDVPSVDTADSYDPDPEPAGTEFAAGDEPAEETARDWNTTSFSPSQEEADEGPFAGTDDIGTADAEAEEDTLSESWDSDQPATDCDWSLPWTPIVAEPGSETGLPPVDTENVPPSDLQEPAFGETIPDVTDAHGTTEYDQAPADETPVAPRFDVEESVTETPTLYDIDRDTETFGDPTRTDTDGMPEDDVAAGPMTEPETEAATDLRPAWMEEADAATPIETDLPADEVSAAVSCDSPNDEEEPFTTPKAQELSEETPAETDESDAGWSASVAETEYEGAHEEQAVWEQADEPPVADTASVNRELDGASAPSWFDMAQDPDTLAPETPPESSTPEETMPEDRLGGVDLNSAGIEEIASLDSVTEAMARRIVDYRDTHGPFGNIFDLLQVPKLGRVTFKRITGMPYSAGGRHRYEKMIRLLGLPCARAAHLPTIICALASQPGLTGAVLSDKDGFVLAASGDDGCASALSAVLPRLWRQMRENTREFCSDDLTSISLCLGGRMFTVAESGNVFLTAAQETNRLTMTQFRLITKVAAELAWLLSRRGYIR